MLINVHNQHENSRKHFALSTAPIFLYINTTTMPPRSKARRTPIIVANEPTSQTIQIQVELGKETPTITPPPTAASSASANEDSEQPPFENNSPEHTIPS